MEKIKIIIVDDHYVVRDGLKLLLNNINDVQVIGEAADSKELFQLLDKEKPDIMFLDLNLPGMSGIEILSQLKEKHPEIKIIVFSGFIDDQNTLEAIEAGALGILPKNSSYEELTKAISNVREGKEFLSNSITQNLTKLLFAKTKSQKQESDINLTKREIEILKLLSEGLISKEIAEKLEISVRTVENHKTNMMQKIGVNTTVELVKYAIKNKIIDI